MEFLPHRYPFLLVDRIVEFDAHKRILGYKNVTVNEPFFEGHFPGKPVMPGVLIIEALAQISGVMAFKSKDQRPSDKTLYYLAGVDKARFKRPVAPGDRLDLHSDFRVDRRGVLKFACTAHVDDELACKADITCMVVDLT